MVRMIHDPTTRAYVERRRAESKTDREIRRVLKRYLASGTVYVARPRRSHRLPGRLIAFRRSARISNMDAYLQTERRRR